MLDVMLGSCILILLVGFIQYTVLEMTRVKHEECRLVADILLREQLDGAELEKMSDRQAEINGIIYQLSTNRYLDDDGRQAITASCHWQEGGREYTLERRRPILYDKYD